MSAQPVAVAPIPRGALSQRVGRSALDWLPAAVVLVLVLVLWEATIAIFDIKRFLAPQPTAIAGNFWDNRGELLHGGWFTFQEAFGGWLIGCGLGILVAIVLARWRRLGRALQPYAVAASAIPIIAFAPITNAWFGPFGKTSKMAIAAVLCFFPVFVTHSIAEAVFLSTRVVVMSPRPGRVANIVDIDLPYPRAAQAREDPRYFELVTRVREALHLGSDLDAVAQ